MNRTRNIAVLFVLCFAGFSGLMAQEVITPLFSNPRAAKLHKSVSRIKKSAEASLLELPLFDDFSNSSLVADTSIWSDLNAFVNNSFAIEPVSNGVATMDALDPTGSIYAHAAISPRTFVADHLSSRTLNLAYPASDSIYLSFLFQAGGLCDLPEEQDSLLVDFYDSAAATWINVWRIPGEAMQPFRHVMIPVTDARFLNSEFRFRFRNLASLSKNNDYPDKRGNVDYWHLDYVRMDRNRFVADTILRDVAFNSPLSSILKGFTSLPWIHFETAKNSILAPHIAARYRNNDSITHNVNRSLSILEPLYNEVYIPGTPTAQDLPQHQDTVVEYGYIYPLDFNRGDSALLRMKAALRTDEFDPKVNDTVIHDQWFKDYYAYDDGTAEAGYGLRGSGSDNGMAAIAYHAFESCKLGGVDIYFNQLYDSINLKNYSFNLMVWDLSGDLPGSVIWEDAQNFHPIYTSTYTGFIRYTFSEPVPVNGPFFVGWRQHDEYLLNVGLDLNSQVGSLGMAFNTGSWEASQAPGVIMFRPFLSDGSMGVPESSREARLLSVYPNPARDRVWFTLPPDVENNNFSVQLFDYSGRLVHQSALHSNSIDLSGLEPGIYLLRMQGGNEYYYSKILIQP